MTLYIEMACNEMFGVGSGWTCGPDPPDESKTFSLKVCSIAPFEVRAWDLLWVGYSLSLSVCLLAPWLVGWSVCELMCSFPGCLLPSANLARKGPGHNLRYGQACGCRYCSWGSGSLYRQPNGKGPQSSFSLRGHAFFCSILTTIHIPR